MTVYHLQSVDNDLRGRLALVTGSSGGIGSACAKTLASEGCDVVLHYSASKEKSESLASELQKCYPSQVFVTAQADLTDRESTRSLVSRILSNPVVSEKHKAISVLVANAGLGRRIRDVKDIGEQDWDEMMEVNIRSQFVVTKSCVEGMRAQEWGRVILVGSIASRGSGLNGCHYAASKGALSSMGLNLATLLAPDGVTVNVDVGFRCQRRGIERIRSRPGHCQQRASASTGSSRRSSKRGGNVRKDGIHDRAGHIVNRRFTIVYGIRTIKRYMYVWWHGSGRVEANVFIPKCVTIMLNQ